MPSKGGSREPAVGSGVAAMAGAVVAPAPPPTAFEFNAADLGMALRRGSEVDRFNELNRRLDELTDPELDELYGYRLRRLQARLRRLDRVRTSDNEGAIREALDDLDVPLQRL